MITPRRLPAAALAVAVVSLAANALLFWHLRHPERWAGDALARISARLSESDATFRYDVRLPAGTPLQLDIPVDERFTVRVDTVIPVRTRVRVPLRSPLGSYDLAVPFEADIPLRGAIPLHVRHTFRLRTRTDQEIVVPLEIRVRELPLEEMLR